LVNFPSGEFSIAKACGVQAKSGAMPQSLTWNSGMVWNSSTPGALWNGTANTSHTTMTQDLIALDISDADWTAIDAALTTLETKLGDKLLDLTVEQRSRLTKMGDKSEAFCRQALITGRLNVVKLPTDAAADLTAEETDLADLDKLRPRLARLTAITEKANDSEVAVGSDIMVFCLTLYGILKAIGAGAGLDALKAQMGARFARGPKAPAPTPPTP
jgi:hypothetical protein